ncbi:MAG: hypothetical protein K2H23_05820 [Oscillospiraceae bacterium]|nr:hypothetical protein [Oscillospiraceae bacterium]
MPFFALIGGVYLLYFGLTGKGKAFKSKIGTPLTGKEAKAVKITYIVVGAVLLLIALISGIELFTSV